MEKNNRPQAIIISPKTIILIVGLFVAYKLFFALQSVIIALFVSFLIATAVYPLVAFLEKYKIPRNLSSFLILFAVATGFFSALASLLPLITAQSALLFKRLPEYTTRFEQYSIDIPNSIVSQFGSLSSNLLKVAIDTFSVAVFVFTMFVISFYLIRERRHLDSHLDRLFAAKADWYKQLYVEIETNVGAWVRGIGLLMFIVGLLTYVGLSLIGIDYALPLAIIAGVLEVVPNLGPTVAAIPAVIVGFATSPVHGVLVIVLAILVQQLENNLIVPQVMNKTTGLHPLATILAILCGFQLGGPVMAILSLPTVLAAKVIIHHYTLRHDHLIPKK
ncbi:hypothetical protein A2368_00840 [Candidatus Collierbacteria bacterium RIFOXYB1_FULL_49_13]|uniref:AI-2E family transporter n=1 Tax=Candidatus Collierbacteria bacterium RIFOXYB1_FULL_49_13 TaxID=1817728 RepID=A0A1F5FHH2_9BACT|nr:MAG: hypothetical protein A2368_00840 [Candidatus Collierbacteria bacterium RIFOXYB1_FULL_49_13]